MEWRAHTTQIRHIEADAEKHCQEVLTTTNTIEDAIQKNNVIFGEKWETTHNRIKRRSEDIHLLRNQIVDLKALSGLQQNALQSCQSTIAGLEETVLKLAASVTVLEKSVCRCRDRLLSPTPHFVPGEEEMVEETEEEEGLEYATDTPLGGSYTTSPSTGGHLSPLPAPSRSPTPGNSDPENNAALRTEELETRIEAFLVLSKRWYILHYHRSTLLLPFRGEVVAGGGGVEERSEVIYFIEGYTVIYYREHNSHSCIT